MVTADARHVAYRLKELLGWADYIVDSLARDQTYELGKVEALHRIAGEDALREIRRLAWELREKLYVAATVAELSPPAEVKDHAVPA
jgi:hypothetical protein